MFAKPHPPSTSTPSTSTPSTSTPSTSTRSTSTTSSPTSGTARRRLGRTGWCATGVVAALLAGGGVAYVHAAGNGGGTRSVFVPISPCRLLDTRGEGTVGPRATPIVAGESLTVAVRGTNGNCTIPTDATAIMINTTAVNSSASTYVTLYPAELTKVPLASNLNTIAGQAPTPNLVNVTLSPDGAIKIYNNNGTIDIVGDITGYYAPEATGGNGTTGPQGPAGPTGPQGPQGLPGD